MFLFFNLFSALVVDIYPHETFTFEDHISKAQLYKFEFFEHGNEKIKVTVKDSLGRVYDTFNNNYISSHMNIKKPTTLHYTVENPHDKKIQFFFRCPDVNKEIVGALGHIEEIDVIADLEDTLRDSIKHQRNHLNNQKQHLEMARKNSRFIKFILILEIIFCLGVVYYLHDDVIRIFERRQKV
ncbi:hypothetical protein SLOPH_1211 [Spraguea lophii 42_110]|uniref:GOLD domain-containing protein n=1 Tax=Spraguea lophii (strain 42_110) TaxID=1358809 RepID=S7XKB0_SPRLO|nr:hypothetical protein SLOPH_1211 [Spraguea lophii 42_110]